MTRIPIDLYQHTVRYPSASSILVSRSGRRGDAHSIPRSLVTMPLHVTNAKPANEAVTRGQFHIEDWKLRELGWMQTADENQERLAL
jgi:hypothetical protein